MHELTHANVHTFQKRFQLRGGRLQRFVIRTRPGDSSTGDIRLIVREFATNKPVRLRLSFEGVQEYRFQRRPGPGLVRLKEVQFGFFEDLIYLNLDAFHEDGPPMVIDFRASDCFVAGRGLKWEVVARKAV